MPTSAIAEKPIAPPTGQQVEGPEDRVLEIRRVLDAPRPMVWAAWTDREQRTKWWGPKGWKLTFARFDDEIGGCWRVGMAGDGRTGVQRGVLRELVPNMRLVQTHAWEDDNGLIFNDTLMTVDFSDTPDGKTLMVFRQGPFMSKDFRDGHLGGWGSAFERLDALLAGADPS